MDFVDTRRWLESEIDVCGWGGTGCLPLEVLVVVVDVGGAMYGAGRGMRSENEVCYFLHVANFGRLIE